MPAYSPILWRRVLKWGSFLSDDSSLSGWHKTSQHRSSDDWQSLSADFLTPDPGLPDLQTSHTPPHWLHQCWEPQNKQSPGRAGVAWRTSSIHTSRSPNLSESEHARTQHTDLGFVLLVPSSVMGCLFLSVCPSAYLFIILSVSLSSHLFPWDKGHKRYLMSFWSVKDDRGDSPRGRSISS